MATIAEVLAFGIGHHRAGRLANAEAVYRRVLEFDPQQPDALHLLGVTYQQRGDHSAAIDLIERAISERPDNPTYHVNLAVTMRAQGRMSRALAAVDRAIALAPDAADGWNSLGLLHTDQRDFAAATGALRRALDIEPVYPIAWNNLGVVHGELGNVTEAAACYRRAIALQPEYAAAHDHLGQVLLQLGRPIDAELCHRRALALAPDLAPAHSGLGAALNAQGQADAAVLAFHQAIELDPVYAAARANLGNALHTQRRHTEAIVNQQAALALSPGLAVAYVNLGASYFAVGSIDLAIAVSRRAVELHPEQAAVHNNLGIALQAGGKLEEAISSYRRALLERPDFLTAHANLAFALLYDPALAPDEFLAELRALTDRHAPAAPAARFVNPAIPDRRLRIGYVSANFRHSPTGHNLQSFYVARDRAAFEVVSYAQVLAEDDLTTQFRAESDHWRSIVGLSDQAAAELIRSDQVDILVTTAGWFDGNRPMIAAFRPAPIQITVLDAATSGLPANDYWLTDAYLHPDDSTDPHVEELVRLPHLSTCLPPTDAPEIGPNPALANGFVTFGSCNNPVKIGSGVVELWSRVLHAVPGSRLVLKYLNWYANSDIRARYVGQFGSHGVAPDRILFETGEGERNAHLAFVTGIDIALDPFPFNGWTSTLEALWMGVPVVTLAGRRYVGRSGGSHLHAVGLDELIAPDEDGFVEICRVWAADTERRSALRRSIRNTMLSSPLFDHRGFIHNVEAAYRSMWRQWCEAHGVRR